MCSKKCVQPVREQGSYPPARSNPERPARNHQQLALFDGENHLDTWNFHQFDLIMIFFVFNSIYAQVIYSRHLTSPHGFLVNSPSHLLFDTTSNRPGGCQWSPVFVPTCENLRLLRRDPGVLIQCLEDQKGTAFPSIRCASQEFIVFILYINSVVLCNWN